MLNQKMALGKENEHWSAAAAADAFHVLTVGCSLLHLV
jgi:hypothetical protein